MTQLSTSRNALSLAAVALLAACGGGETSPITAQDFAARISAGAQRSDRLHALAVGGGSSAAAADATVTNALAFQWAQLQFPEIFGTAAPVNIGEFAYAGKVYDVRQFGSNYLGISGGRAYGLGTFTGGQLVDFGAIQSYSSQICARLNCEPTGGGGGTGALNGCVLPASEALRIGNQFRAVYTSTTLVPSTIVGEYQLEGEVKAAVTFEGQSAVRVQSKITGTQAGVAIDSNTDVFEQVGSNGLINSLGVESVTSVSGITLTLRTVNNPADVNTEFTLSPGQSLTKTVNTTASYINAPFPLPPTTSSTTSTYTYEARESVTVLGRSYDTCRYKEVTAGATEVTYSWYIYGKGIPALIEARSEAGALLGKSELKSGSLNGAAL